MTSIRLVLASLVLLSAQAEAQTTSVIIRSRTTTTTTVYVPAAPGAATTRRPADVGIAPPSFGFEAQELTPYLSGRCAELWQVLHVPSRLRINRSEIDSLNREERDQCGDQEYAARQQLSRDKAAKYDNKFAQAVDARNRVAQDKLKEQQCDELLRNLAGERKRLATMTDGQRADHQHFESVYAERCGGAR